MFWNNFYTLCKEHKKTPTEVVEELGIARGSITKWKNGSMPSGKNLNKLAEYFCVSTSTFFVEKKPSAESEELIRKLLENGSGKAHYIMFGGENAEVREIPPEAEAIIKSVLETFEKKNND